MLVLSSIGWHVRTRQIEQWGQTHLRGRTAIARHIARRNPPGTISRSARSGPMRKERPNNILSHRLQTFFAAASELRSVNRKSNAHGDFLRLAASSRQCSERRHETLDQSSQFASLSITETDVK